MIKTMVLLIGFGRREIWQSYFTQAEIVGYVGTYLNGAAWELLKQRMVKW